MDDLQDKNLLDDVLADDDLEPTPTDEKPVEAQEPETHKAEPAPEPTEPEAAPEGDEEPKGHNVPLGTLMEERKLRQEAEKRAQESESRNSETDTKLQSLQNQFQGFQQALTANTAQQPAQEPIDILEDPEGFKQSLIQSNEQALKNQTLNMSEAYARNNHGDDVVEAALNATKNAGIAHSFLNHADPFGAMVKWHKNQEIVSQTGGDLDGFRDKIEAELKEKVRADVLKELGVAAPGDEADPPPSLTDTTSAAGNDSPLKSEDEVFQEIF